MTEPSVRLHGYPVSNYFNIVRAALLEKRIRFEVVPTRASQDVAMLQKSPMGKIPFLETDQGWLAETVAILEFLEDRWPQPPLYPAEPFQRARARQVINIAQMYIDSPARTLYPGVFQGGANEAAVVDSARHVLDRAIVALGLLIAPSPFLLGKALSYADLFLYYCLDLTDRVTRSTFAFSIVHQLDLVDWARRIASRQSTRIVSADFCRVFPDYLSEKGASYRGPADLIGQLDTPRVAIES